MTSKRTKFHVHGCYIVCDSCDFNFIYFCNNEWLTLIFLRRDGGIIRKWEEHRGQPAEVLATGGGPNIKTNFLLWTVCDVIDLDQIGPINVHHSQEAKLSLG